MNNGADQNNQEASLIGSGAPAGAVAGVTEQSPVAEIADQSPGTDIADQSPGTDIADQPLAPDGELQPRAVPDDVEEVAVTDLLAATRPSPRGSDTTLRLSVMSETGDRRATSTGSIRSSRFTDRTPSLSPAQPQPREPQSPETKQIVDKLKKSVSSGAAEILKGTRFDSLPRGGGRGVRGAVKVKVGEGAAEVGAVAGIKKEVRHWWQTNRVRLIIGIILLAIIIVIVIAIVVVAATA